MRTLFACFLVAACSSPPVDLPRATSIPGPDFGRMTLRAASADVAPPKVMDPEIAAIVAEIPAPVVTSVVTCRDFRWTLAAPSTVGRYWNGEPWVVGPVSVVAIEPAPVTNAAGRRLNGSMKTIQRRWNQYGSTTHGFDGDQDYDASLDVSRQLPVHLGAGESLISVRSDDPKSTHSMVRYCAVLTVVAAPPSVPTFRPTYWGPIRLDSIALSDVDLDLLPSVLPLSYASQITQMAESVSQSWLVGGVEWVSYMLHPAGVVPPYYRDKMAMQGEMLLALCSRASKAQKARLALGLAQYGIDVMGAVRNGAWWDGGHGPGRKGLVVFAGLLTGAPELVNPNGFCRGDLQTSGGMPTTHEMVFGEDHTTFWITRDAQGRINGGHGNYTAADVGLAEWGNWHHSRPERDDSGWPGASGYRVCCWANGWIGECLAMRLMGLIRAWDHDPYFAYTDRYFRWCRANGLPDWQTSWSPVARQAWLDYRRYDLPGSSTIGPVAVGTPQLIVTIPPYHDQQWTIDIEVGSPGMRAGLLVRSRSIAQRPSRYWYGWRTEGMVYLEQGQAEAAAPFTTGSDGRIVVSLPPSLDPPGTQYSLQAVVLDDGVLRTTNAIDVVTLDH